MPAITISPHNISDAIAKGFEHLEEPFLTHVLTWAKLGKRLETYQGYVSLVHICRSSVLRLTTLSVEEWYVGGVRPSEILGREPWYLRNYIISNQTTSVPSFLQAFELYFLKEVWSK